MLHALDEVERTGSVCVLLHGMDIWDLMLSCAVVLVTLFSLISQVLALVLPHMERRCRSNGLKLGTLMSDTKQLGYTDRLGILFTKPWVGTQDCPPSPS